VEDAETHVLPPAGGKENGKTEWPIGSKSVLTNFILKVEEPPDIFLEFWTVISVKLWNCIGAREGKHFDLF